MAQRHTTYIMDDLDGTTLESAETLTFSLEGSSYEIDLSATNADALRASMAPFIAAARPASKRSGAKARPGGSPRDLEKVREWARDNGYTVSDRGRVKAEILEAFDAVH